MNETTYVYIVHSDIDENNLYAEFATEGEAIDYAIRHKDDLTWVEKAEAALDEDGDIIEIFDSETIWVFDDTESEEPITENEYWDMMAEEEEDKKFSDLGDTTWFEGLDTEALVEKMEENEDMVECKECFELFPKQDGFKIEFGYVCPHCHQIRDTNIEPVADEDIFKLDFPDVEKFNFGNDMIPDEPNPEPMPEIGPNPEPMAEPCVGPECEAPVEAPVTKEETITKLVVDEHEAIDGYEKAKIEIEANSELDEKEKEEILDTIEHIKEEEVEHIEELEELVDTREELAEAIDEDSEEAENLLGCRITLEQIVSGLESKGYKAQAAVEEVSDEDSAFCCVRVVTPNNEEVSISLIPNGEILLDGDNWYGTIDYLAPEYFNEDEEIFVRAAIEEIVQFFKEESKEVLTEEVLVE